MVEQCIHGFTDEGDLFIRKISCGGRLREEWLENGDVRCATAKNDNSVAESAV